MARKYVIKKEDHIIRHTKEYLLNLHKKKRSRRSAPTLFDSSIINRLEHSSLKIFIYINTHFIAFGAKNFKYNNGLLFRTNVLPFIEIDSFL
jgi:hypothetical protein